MARKRCHESWPGACPPGTAGTGAAGQHHCARPPGHLELPGAAGVHMCYCGDVPRPGALEPGGQTTDEPGQLELWPELAQEGAAVSH